MNSNTTTEDILHILQSAEFERWYQEELNDFILGERGARTREEILEDLREFFG